MCLHLKTFLSLLGIIICGSCGSSKKAENKAPVAPAPIQEVRKTNPTTSSFKIEKFNTQDHDGQNVEIIMVSFETKHLRVIDHNASTYLSGWLDSATVKKLVSNPNGILAWQAAEWLNTEGHDIFVSGGNYFANNQYLTTTGRKQTEGLTLVGKNSTQPGWVLSEMNGLATSTAGGFFRVPWTGEPHIIRKNETELKVQNTQREFCMAADCKKPEDWGKSFRLILQSNAILIFDKAMDAGYTPTTAKSSRVALASLANNKLAIFITFRDVTLLDFAESMLEKNALQAVNLDGGPSTQFSTKTKESLVNYPANKESSVNPMTQLLVVSSIYQ